MRPVGIDAGQRMLSHPYIAHSKLNKKFLLFLTNFILENCDSNANGFEITRDSNLALTKTSPKFLFLLYAEITQDLGIKLVVPKMFSKFDL